MSAPWFGFITPLLVRSATQFAPPPPPALTSARYTRDFNEVKALGSANSTERTESQTSTARFFSANALCSTTPHCAINLADTDGHGRRPHLGATAGDTPIPGLPKRVQRVQLNREPRS